MTKKITINSVEELMELSAMSAGAVVGHTNKDQQTEALLRSYIRNKIKTIVEDQTKQEQLLRKVIRGIIKEAKESANPHPNTGINMLRDSFRKAKPTIKNLYQQLTTSKEQRDSFTAHLLAAFVRLFDQLDAISAQGATEAPPEISPTAEPTPASGELAAPSEKDISDIEAEVEDLLEQVGIKIDDEEDEKDIVSDEIEAEKPKTQVEKDFAKKKEQEQERSEFAGGMEGEITGRNQAFDAFRLTQSYFSDAYMDLADEQDRKMYKEWCLYNLDLLLKSFEDELTPDIEKPQITAPEGA